MALREEVLPLRPSYDRYGRQPIGIGGRHRHRRRVSSRTPERENSISPDARRKASVTVKTVEEPFTRVAEVHEASR